MEKYRFYLDLPGDFWESGTLLKYLREREVQVRGSLRATRCELDLKSGIVGAEVQWLRRCAERNLLLYMMLPSLSTQQRGQLQTLRLKPRSPLTPVHQHPPPAEHAYVAADLVG